MIYNIIFCGFPCSESTKLKVSKEEKYPQFQGLIFQANLINVINKSRFNLLKVIGCAPASAYPNNKLLHIPGEKWCEGATRYISFPYINIPGIRHLQRSLLLLLNIIRSCSRHRVSALLIYPYYTPFLLPAILLRYFFKYKIIVISMDHPSFMIAGIKISLAKKIVKYVDALLFAQLLRICDGVIVLSSKMKKLLRLSPNKIEVIYPFRHNRSITSRNNNNSSVHDQISLSQVVPEKYVFYGGALVNTQVAVEAVIELNDEGLDIGLAICGSGVDNKMLSKLSQESPFICHLGFIDDYNYKQVLANSFACLVLGKDGKHEAYSFPSKLVELMLNGKLCIVSDKYNLDQDISSLIFEYDQNSKEDLKRIIKQLYNLPKPLMDEKSAKVYEFARLNLSEGAASSKVNKFLGNILC